MLNDMKNWPEAGSWIAFSSWHEKLATADFEGMLELLRSFGSEDRGMVRFFVKKIDKLGHDAYHNPLDRSQGYPDTMSAAYALSEKQEYILNLCRFVCFEKKDVAKGKVHSSYLPGGTRVLQILPWHKPAWFAEIYEPFIAESESWVEIEDEYKDQEAHLEQLQQAEDFFRGVVENMTPDLAKIYEPVLSQGLAECLKDPVPDEHFRFSYAQCLECERMGALNLNPEIVAPRLGQELLASLSIPKRLKKLLDDNHEIMERDIWSLFTTEFWTRASVMFCRGDIRINAARTMLYNFFVEKCATGELDKRRVFKECIRGIDRNFSINQTSLYLPLLTAFKPSKEELLELSSELLGVLSSPNTKAVADALKLLKSIASEKSFPWSEFAKILPVLLALNVKSMQAPALAVAEVLAKKIPECHRELAPALTEAFGSPDEAIQLKAAKCILACGEAAKELQIQQELNIHSGQMTAAVKALLQGLMTEVQADVAEVAVAKAEEVKPVRSSKLDASLLINPPESLDELIFIISTAFVEQEDHHCSFIPDSLYLFREQLDEEVLARLTPAVAAARKNVREISLASPVHSRTVATWFLRWYLKRLSDTGEKNKALVTLKKQIENISFEVSSDCIIKIWHNSSKYYEEYPLSPLAHDFSSLNQVVEAAFNRIDTDDSLPLLSSITHKPFWLNPLTLVERLLGWQRAGREVYGMDLQLALQRCALENKGEVLEASKKLVGECRYLIEYLYGESLPPEKVIAHPAWWITAALTRPERQVPPELITSDFAALPKQYLENSFTWGYDPMLVEADTGSTTLIEGLNYLNISLEKYVSECGLSLEKYLSLHGLSLEQYLKAKESDQISEMQLRMIGSNDLHLNLDFHKTMPQFLGSISYPSKQPHKANLTEQLEKMFAAPMLLGEEGTLVHQTLSLYPNNPEPLLMGLLSALRPDSPPPWLSKNVFIKLQDIGAVHGPASTLLTALGFMDASKEVRLTAGAFWRFSVDENLVDSEALGVDLGRLVNDGRSPVKRLTDLIDTEMLNISPEHSRQLATTVEFLLLNVGPAPLSSIKRFLELYYELVSSGFRTFNPAIKEFLTQWSQQKNYVKACCRLTDLGADTTA